MSGFPRPGKRLGTAFRPGTQQPVQLTGAEWLEATHSANRELQVGMTDQNLPADQNETPEDVATLYSWANLHGAKYRDFSASRAQARDEARKRVEEAQAVEELRLREEAERQAQEEAQIAARLAAEAAEAARQAEAERLAELARQAEAERQAVLAAQLAQRQAAQQQRAWQPAGAPEPYAQSQANDAYASREPERSQPAFAQPQFPATQQPGTQAYAPGFQQQTALVQSQPPSQQAPVERQSERSFGHGGGQGFVPVESQRSYSAGMYPEYGAPSPAAGQQEGFGPASWPGSEPQREARELSSRPAWLAPEPAAPQIQANGQHGGFGGQHFSPPQSAPQGQGGFGNQYGNAYGGQGQGPGVDDTLLGSRDRIASRWFALKNVFDPGAAPAEPAPIQAAQRPPALAVFSLVGGVGKTSLVASLGRALSSRGERILLIDTASFGLLPFFFGARDQRPGMLRTFNPPGISTDAPMQLVTLDSESQTAEAAGPDWLAQEAARFSRGASRMIIDLPTASGSIARKVLKLAPLVLVPVVPDMNSVVSVGAIESFFRHNSGGGQPGGKTILPFYVLNQFDYSLPLHLDVREILREQIGDRLLPFALRRSPQVSEALAEGMTVMDYAPAAMVAEDYASLAGWVRSLSAPATVGYRGVRWSER
jgi:cellulose synthase operon protein YhjQ